MLRDLLAKAVWPRAWPPAIVCLLCCCGAAEGPLENTDDRQVGSTLEPTFRVCPEITSVSATPLATAVGGDIALTSGASEVSSSPGYSYNWFARSGVFSNPAASNTRYTCSEAGLQNLMLFVTDGSCGDVLQVDVACVDPLILPQPEP